MHSGDLGDIMYGLPAVRALGGGRLYVNVRHPRHPDIHLVKKGLDLLVPLLETQPYITGVEEWDGTTQIEYNLDLWRKQKDRYYTPIADNTLTAFGLPVTERDVPWISVGAPLSAKKYSIGRSRRHHGGWPYPWPDTYKKYTEEGVFVGLLEDHEAFVKEVGSIEYYPVDNFLTMARVIAGSTMFIGNQAFPFAIAEAMKHTSLLEVCWLTPNCIYPRPNAKWF